MINREFERRRLREAAMHAPQLVVLRGRRRVGKSYLLNHSLEDEDWLLVYFQADEGEESEHLALFASEVGRVAGAPLRFSDWDAALGYLPTLAATQGRSIVVVLDEYQWLRRAQPRIDSQLMRHFDRWERDRTPITVATSGSAISSMEDLLSGAKPMFGRASYRPLLQPFDYRDAARFGPADASAEAKLRRFGVLGGTAQYQVWAGRDRLHEVMRHRILTSGESLFEEPLQLIRGEDGIREPGSYFAILRAIASGATRAGEIQSRSQVRSSQLLSKRLDRLRELAYVVERQPVGGNGRTRWEIADPYFAFWFRYVYPNRSRLQRGRIDATLAAIESDLDNHLGWVFEQVCRTWVERYANGAAFERAQGVGGYWTRTHDLEVDIAARAGREIVLLGSCKWSRRAETGVLDDLLSARDRIDGAAAAELLIFARGFDARLTRAAAELGVRLVGAEELYG